MQIMGAEYLCSLIEQESFSAKAVFNQNGALFFTVRQQHCDNKAEGVSYEDNYKGNALAAILVPGRMEIRYHRGFTDGRVSEIVRALMRDGRLKALREWRFLYQGRELQV